MPYSEPYTDTSRLRPPTRRPCVQLGVPLYPDHFLFLVQLLLEIDYPIWYGEFEELYCQVSVLERAAEDVFDTIGSKVYSPPEALTALQGDPAQLWKYRNFASELSRIADLPRIASTPHRPFTDSLVAVAA